MTPGPSARAEISVVVPTYQGAKTIVACLASIRDALRGRGGEIIVVDSSTDSTPDLVSTQFPEVRLIHSEHRLSAGAARNRGISAAIGRAVFLTDQDCLVPPDWIGRLESHLADPEIDVVGGSVAIDNPTSLTGNALYFLEFLDHFPARRGAGETSRRFLVGCNLAFRAGALRGTMFPDRTMAEDVLFTRGLRERGVRIRYDTGVAVRHVNKTGWRTFFDYNRRLGEAAAIHQSGSGAPVADLVMRHPSAIFLAPAVVLPTIAARLLRSRLRYAALFAVTAPLCLMGNLAWAYGFWSEAAARPASSRASLERKNEALRPSRP